MRTPISMETLQLRDQYFKDGKDVVPLNHAKKGALDRYTSVSGSGPPISKRFWIKF